MVRRAGQLGWVGVSYRSVAAADPDTFPLAVLANILGVGVTSRLYQALVEPSLSISVSAIAWQLHDPSLFSFFTTLAPGTEHQRAKTCFAARSRRVVERRRDGGRASKGEDADRGRRDLRARHDGPGRGSLTEAIAMADWDWYVDYLPNIQAVTRDDVARAAAGLLPGRCRDRRVVRPEDRRERA